MKVLSMPVLISMSLAVLIWSLYPLAASIGLDNINSLDLIAIVYFFSGFGAILITFLYLWKNKLLKQTIAIQKTLPFKAYIPVIISGIAGILCHTFFIISLTLANKAGVSLLYESWPIIAVIATPMLMRKTWKEVSFKEFLVSICAMVGVSIIILTDETIGSFFPENFNDKLDYTTLSGYILAFAGAYMCAVLVATKGNYSERFEGLNDKIASSLIGEVFSRTVSMFLMSMAFVLLADDLHMPHIDWASTFYVGFVVFVLGGALYTYALLKTDRPTIHVMYYFVPVLAVVWLWVAGESTINLGLFIGGGIILAANIYLVITGRKAPLSKERDL